MSKVILKSGQMRRTVRFVVSTNRNTWTMELEREEDPPKGIRMKRATSLQKVFPRKMNINFTMTFLSLKHKS